MIGYPNAHATIYALKQVVDPRTRTRTTRSSEELYSGECQWRYLQQDRTAPNAPAPNTTELSIVELLIPLTESIPPTGQLEAVIQATATHTITIHATQVEHLHKVGITRIISTQESVRAKQ